MLDGVKKWFAGGEKVAAAKERVVDLERLQASQGELSKKHRAQLEAAEKTVLIGRRNFHLKIVAAFATAVAGSWGAAELAGNAEESGKRKTTGVAANAGRAGESSENGPASPERRLDSFITNFETSFLHLCNELLSKELPMKVKIKIKRLQDMVANNASNAPDGRNYKRHRRNAGTSAESLHSEYFYYNTEDGFEAAGYAFHDALQRMVQFGPGFDLNNRFDALSALHELEHVDQDIKRRGKIDPLSGGQANYLERYTARPGVSGIVGLDDENGAYSLHVEALNAMVDGDLAKAAKVGDLDGVEALAAEYLATKPKNFTSEQDQADYINGLFEFLLSKVENPNILREIREKAQIVTYRQIASFIPLLIFSSHYFRDRFRARDYLQRLYKWQGMTMYENNPDGTFRKME